MQLYTPRDVAGKVRFVRDGGIVITSRNASCEGVWGLFAVYIYIYIHIKTRLRDVWPFWT